MMGDVDKGLTILDWLASKSDDKLVALGHHRLVFELDLVHAKAFDLWHQIGKAEACADDRDRLLTRCFRGMARLISLLQAIEAMRGADTA
jgi:hypothetical protein